jgi:uncharacterized membrane protein
MRTTLTLLLALAAAYVITLLLQNSNAPMDNAIGVVTLVDNSDATFIGASKIGRQKLTFELLSGPQKGQLRHGQSLLTGALEFDEFYQVGDTLLVSIDPATQMVRVHSHFRLPLLVGLFALFAIGLLVYAKRVGLRSLLSFAGAVVILWGVLIQGILHGYPVFPITALTCCALGALIIFCVAGWTRKALAACIGTLIGLAVTSLLCLSTGSLLHLDGMSQPLGQQLYFETGMKLDLLGILYAAVIVGASGAAMDIAMEMAATIEELKIQNPSMSRGELLRSGIKVGNAVIGTMTTTLLLAYSGSFLTLMLIFVSRGADLIQVLNMKIVAAEISRTLIGSIALVIVAPITASIASHFMCWGEQKGEHPYEDVESAAVVDQAEL